MTSNSTSCERHKRSRGYLLAVTLLASHPSSSALVCRSNFRQTRASVPHRSETTYIYSSSSSSSTLTSLNSIGDPERDSDRERRSKDKRSESTDGTQRRRRRNANGKYTRQRKSTSNDKAQSNEQNKPPDGKTKESNKIRTTSNNSLKAFTSGPTKQHDDRQSNNITIDGLKKRVVQLETLVSSQQSEMQKLRREIDDMAKTLGGVVNFVEQLQDFVQDDVSSKSDETRKLSFGTDSDSQPMFTEDHEIFGIAPTTIKDAADSAGQSILSAILAGKHRMLVDVRDAELTRDPSLLVEFIELAILPVAAGLQGLDQYTNRVKIVFPTVKDLVDYRKFMALAAPEVVSLSTLGFDPIEEKDNLIVIVAPPPDDVAGCNMMQKLLQSENPQQRIARPVVVINHHMMPIDTGMGKFTVVYHLRLLSVQYMTGDIVPEYVSENDEEDGEQDKGEGDSALEAAMTHAREIGVHQGVTRAMVIRAYPKPWHVFVDVSPDTDADFEVAATFDSEPTQEDVNYSIVECLEGSEREDELVAKQMQAALDAGQLTRVSEMLGISPNSIAESMGMPSSDSSEEDKNDSDTNDISDWDDLYYDDWFNEDSV
ncbi:hypothetical protein ACHAXN_011198 [Cyclotella atomus]